MPHPRRRPAERRREGVLSWYHREGDGWQLRIHAQPGAKKTQVVGLHGEALKIRICAPPVEGKANEALLRFLAAELGVRLAEVKLVRGETSREKTFHVSGRADPRALLG